MCNGPQASRHNVRINSQTKYLLVEAPTHAPLTPRVLAGAALWLAGWLTNMQADHILINLRKPGETGQLKIYLP